MPKRRFYVENNTVNVKPPFTGRERDPLGWSIKKWRFIVDWHEKNADKEINCGAGLTCALCSDTRNNKGGDCSKCIANGVPGEGCGWFYGRYIVGDSYEKASAARDMLAFLEGLRQKG